MVGFCSPRPPFDLGGDGSAKDCFSGGRYAARAIGPPCPPAGEHPLPFRPLPLAVEGKRGVASGKPPLGGTRAPPARPHVKTCMRVNTSDYGHAGSWTCAATERRDRRPDAIRLTCRHLGSSTRGPAASLGPDTVPHVNGYACGHVGLPRRRLVDSFAAKQGSGLRPSSFRLHGRPLGARYSTCTHHNRST